MNDPAPAKIFPPPSARAAAGWAFCLALGGVLLSLFFVPPKTRVLPAFDFPAKVRVGEAAEERDGVGGSLIGAAVDIVGAGGWHLPASYRYRYLPDGGVAAGDVDVLATYMVTPRVDARRMPELYATSPWCSAESLDKTWTTRATQHSGHSGLDWLEVRDWQGIYLVARIAPDGSCTSTADQARERRIGGWRENPLKALGWPFSARPEVDQRAVWVRMTVNLRVDGAPRSPEEIERLWRDVLTAYGRQVRTSLQR